MSTHKNIDRICVIAVVLALLLTSVLMCCDFSDIIIREKVSQYEKRLFDTQKVHTIDIVIDDWDKFLSTCQSEEYSVCDVIIDGESFQNIAIRGKGNTSLSTVSSMDSNRYSFKIEFDHYSSGNSYYGLDKLSLNNVIQDNTYMKDYLTYRLMVEFGVPAPLCSFVYITVNGEDWGLYLAVEGIEDSFLERNYGSDYGELYKPDSMSFGGGRGNGRDFDMDAFLSSDDTSETDNSSTVPSMGNMPQMPENFDPSSFGGNVPENFEPSEIFGNENQIGKGGFGGKGGMGSSDVKLQYIDDNESSYTNIFDNAKTDITTADKTRLIESLKALSEGKNIESVVDTEDVIRYFVVHNYVCNGDSYTGSMIHNYYLYEKDGQMSMIPWDYNLAFGTFQSSSATSTVNSPIDTPVSSESMEDRPMINWIFQSDFYTQMYHTYFTEFIDTVDIEAVITQAETLIAPYVEEDPTKFCTYEEFTKGVATLKEFCKLRSESISGQLGGTIPATSREQSADSSALIDASHITLSDMGTMNMGGGFGGNKIQRPSGNQTTTESTTSQSQETTEEAITDFQSMTPPQGGDIPQGFPQQGNIPQGGETPQMPEGMQGGNMQAPPEGMGGGRGQRPEGFPGMNSTQEEPPTMPNDIMETTNQSETETTSSQTRPGRGDMPGNMMPSGAVSSEGIVTVAVSIAVLAVGMIFAMKFKRRKDG